MFKNVFQQKPAGAFRKWSSDFKNRQTLTSRNHNLHYINWQIREHRFGVSVDTRENHSSQRNNKGIAININSILGSTSVVKSIRRTDQIKQVIVNLKHRLCFLISSDGKHFKKIMFQFPLFSCANSENLKLESFAVQKLFIIFFETSIIWFFYEYSSLSSINIS